jgi:hypothetical protein
MKNFTAHILKGLCLSTVLLLGTSVNAQNFEWASAFGGTGDNFGQGVRSDAAGNVYSAGYFFNDIDLDPGTGTAISTSTGQQDMYVSKLDPSGTYLWGHSFGDLLRDRCNAINIDAAGNVYLTGYFEGTLDFDPGSGNEIRTSMTDRDIFVLKLDTDGNFVWVSQFEGTMDGEGVSLEVDENENVYVTGLFQGTYDFDPTAGTHYLTALGNRDAFVLKLNSNGGLNWVAQQSGADNGYGISIDLDNNGNIGVAGFFAGTIDFIPGPGTFALTSNGSFDLFALKLDNNGNFMWVRAFGDAGQERGEGIVIDNNNDFYITGRFQNTVNFDPGVTDSTLISGGVFDAYVLKLTSNGDFAWVNQIKSTTNNIGFELSKDPQENLYATGYFTGAADFMFQNDTTTISATSGNSAFIQKFTTAGEKIWIETVEGAGSSTSADLHVTSNWDVHTSGYFSGTADFDPTASNFSVNSLDGNDAYVHKISQTCTAPSLDSINYSAADTLFCPSAMASAQLIAIGNLNDATDWKWYTDGCGVTHVESGDTVTFMPSETTTYYLRAEGACGTVQSCDSITIHIDDTEAPIADVATLDDITEICEVTQLFAPTATDNCEGTIQGTHDAVLPITSDMSITWTYADATGNETIQTQEVIMSGVDVATSVNGIQLIANNDNVGVDYRWLDCNNNNQPIIDATNQSYTPEANGSYAVIVLEEGCQDTSDCIDVTTVSLEDFSKTNINVYPNPSAGEFNVALATADKVSYIVTDNTGRIILEGTFEKLENVIDLSTEEQGVYFLRVEGSVIKLVVN